MFEFGAGLSYTTFTVSSGELGGCPSADPLILQIEDVMSTAELVRHPSDHGPVEYNKAHPAVSYEVNVTNTGSVASDAVVLGFLSASATLPDTSLASGISPPLSQLFNYQRVSALSPGESSTVLLTLSLSSLALFDLQGHSWLVPGVYEVWMGGSSDQSSVPRPDRRRIQLAGLMRQLTWAPYLSAKQMIAAD